MPRFTVSKSITIHAAIGEVFSSVRDFRQWPAWSPWLIAEPDCQLSFAGDGKSYAWDGTITGSGEMEIAEEDPPHLIRYRLTFLKPWKSTSDVTFRFAEQDGGVLATWTMDGSLPVFMFWMTKMMGAFIGSDYERGLTMLKQHIEHGEVQSKLAFPGIQTVPGCRYLGIRNSCPITRIGESMQSDLSKLKTWIGKSKITPAGSPFSICHKWNPVKGSTEYTLAIPLDPPPSPAPGGMVSGELPSTPCYVVRHTGPYPQLGNAWSAGMMRGRAKVFRGNRKIPPFEVYQNSPEDVPENELVTLVHFPVKA